MSVRVIPIRSTCCLGVLAALGLAVADPVRGQGVEPAPEPRPAGPAADGGLGGVTALDPSPPPPPVDPYRIDTDRFIFSRVQDDARIKDERENREEFEAYNEVLLKARQFPAADLEKHAEKGVAFKDLVTEVRQDYQFKLLYFEGRLKRLRKLEPTKPLKAAGVDHLYEGWMFPRNGADPVCVLTTELPEGLEPTPAGTDYNPSKMVGIAGYSFKLMWYESSAPNPKDPTRQQLRRAPLLMGRAFTLLADQEVDTPDPWRTAFLPGILAVLGGIAVVVLGLTWWFRTGDKTVRQELNVRRERNPFDGSMGGPSA